MGTQQERPTSGKPGVSPPAGNPGEVIPTDAKSKIKQLGNGQVEVTLPDGRVLRGTKMPDGRIIRGAS